MSPKIVIGTVIAIMVLIIGAAFGLSRPQAKPEVNPESSGKLTASETFYDFGSISMAKGVVSKKFTVTNDDSRAATITKMFTSCMCTKAKLSTGGQEWGPYGMPGHGGSVPKIAAEIAADQTGEVEVIFDPAAHGPAGIGQIERTVTVEQNGQEPLTFGFRAMVTP